MSLIKNLLLFLFILQIVSTLGLVRLTDRSALCLDGTVGGYYISKGDPDKVILYFQGGTWCASPQLNGVLLNCYLRANSSLGSSNYFQNTITIKQGLLSNEEGNYFKNWTKVYLKYCDGTGHQGTRSQPISFKGKRLFFRGQNITIAQLQSLQSSIHLFSKVQKIIVSGADSGAIAALSWTNYIVQKAKNAKVWSVPDSGIFLDVGTHNLSTQLQTMFKLSNVQSDPPVTQCVKKFLNQKHKCMFAQNLYEYIKAPLFVVQSLYDTGSFALVINTICNDVVTGDLSNCTKQQMQKIQQYHKLTKNMLIKMGTKSQNGYWAPACATHVFSTQKFTSQNYRIPMNTQYSYNNCLKAWINKQQNPYNHRHMDTVNWPNNKPCSGKQKITTQ